MSERIAIAGYDDVSQFLMHIVCHFLNDEQIEHVGNNMKDGKVDVSLTVAGIELPLVPTLEAMVKDINQSFEDGKRRVAYDHIQKEGFDPVINLLNEWSDLLRDKMKAYRD